MLLTKRLSKSWIFRLALIGTAAHATLDIGQLIYFAVTAVMDMISSLQHSKGEIVVLVQDVFELFSKIHNVLDKLSLNELPFFLIQIPGNSMSLGFMASFLNTIKSIILPTRLVFLVISHRIAAGSATTFI